MSSDTLLRVGRVLHGTTAEGPGKRTAVWVQGCSIRCSGCINPHLFSARGGELLDPETIIVGALSAGDEGITLLGGEPFDQAASCAVLAAGARREGLGVICFTGFAYESLVEDHSAVGLLNEVDLLIDGPYIADPPERDRALVGSTNQRFLALTPRYAEYEPAVARNRVEVRISSDGAIDLAGYLDRADLQTFADALGSRRTYRREPQTHTAFPDPRAGAPPG